MARRHAVCGDACRRDSPGACRAIGVSTMDCEIEQPMAAPAGYKLICDQCGSLTIALPAETSPSPHSVLTCGRCGAPRGTLQSLRDRSNRNGWKSHGLPGL